MRFDNKAALITGGASGFGRRIAELFAREGARVAIADINEPAAREAAAAISNTAIAMRCDVSQRADVDAAVQATQDAFGGIDILINNAGMSHKRRPMLEVEEDEFDRLMAVNVKSIFLFAHAVVPLMRKKRSGVIINIGSTAGSASAGADVVQCVQGRGKPAVEIHGGRAGSRRHSRLRGGAGHGRHAVAADLHGR